MAILYLIRHAEPQTKGVLLGRQDSPLSAAGCEQASAMLSGLAVSVTYCSPLLRARQTAAYLHSDRKVELADLCEIDYGEWTGKTWAQVEAQWPLLAAAKCADWLGVSAPGGESWPDVLKRVAPIWQTIRAGEHPAAIVGHQGVNAALANLIDGRNPAQFVQQYAEVIRIEYS